MANPVHLEKLCQGPVAWNEWREANPYVVPDLSHATLALSQRQFGPSNGGPIDLRAADLEGAMLRFATLTEADLEGANLKNADLMHARLDRAKLIAADLTDASLDHADFTAANLSRAVVMGASFTNARNLTQQQIGQAFGDATTALPAALTPPENWFAPFDDGPQFSQYPVPEPEKEDDLYDILGLSRTAEPEDIRTAHRALVKTLHPDLNPGDAAAQDRFKKVSNAYRILGDPEKRRAYDRDEIDAEGRIRPEFEARQEFRRYAFRFYAAAVVALFIAAGALAFVWHQVMRTPGESARVAASLPKLSGRLVALPPERAALPDKRIPRVGTDAGRLAQEAPPEEQARNALSGGAATVTVLAGPPPQTKRRDAAREAGPPGIDDAEEDANSEAGPPGRRTAAYSAGNERDIRPLGQAHEEDQAGEAEASPARPTAAESEAQASLPSEDRPAGGDGDAVRGAFRTFVPGHWGDPISALFYESALARAVAEDQVETTASIQTGALVNGRSENTEIDVETSATPARSLAGAFQPRPLPAFLGGQQKAERSSAAIAGAGRIPALTRIPERRQAVSDLFTGGL